MAIIALPGRLGRGESRRLPEAPFAHPSERVFARLMDFHRIDWQYEPRSFPISWDEKGNPCESFTPDFYLPELDLYVELTTMKQSLVRRKNRKLKRLRQLYPEVNIRVFYQKDLEHLVFKLGSDMAAANQRESAGGRPQSRQKAFASLDGPAPGAGCAGGGPEKENFE